jgi:NitT/TauT family transport system substrate-binding protein
MRRKVKWLAFTFALFVGVGALMWTASNLNRGVQQPDGLEDVVVAVYEGDVSLLVYVAREQGFFRDEGLRVTLKEYEAGKLATDELVRGGADIATAGELVFITNLSQNPDLRFFGIVSDFRIDQLIGRRDRGIDCPESLRAARIGVLKQATSEYLLGRFLTMQGLSYDDVEIVYLNPSGIVDSLLAGTIDAGQTWDPNIYHLKRELQTNAFVFPAESGFEPTETFLLITRAQWLEQNPGVSRRFLDALVRAERFVRSAPDKAMEFMADRFALTPEYAAYVMPKIDFKVELSQVLLFVMDNETRWAIKAGIVPFEEVPNYLDYVHLDALEAVKPEAITVIR